ncbi:MAG: YggT family protein [Candidatus Eiseniibacteriota bacterium]
MFVLGNLLNALASLLDVLIQALMLVLIVNAVLSWVRPDPSNPIVMFLERVSDAVCDPIRRLFPTVFSGIDFAPFIVLLLLQFLGRSFVVQSLHGLAMRMG